MMNIGKNLRKFRTIKTSFSQKEVADLLEVDRRTYINWENNDNNVKSEFIPKLAEIFDVEIKDLFEEAKTNIEITQTHNEGKDNSLLNGAILIITDKQSVEDLMDVIKSKAQK
jgi:transcriptional regulator with XRE-family HTH domain